jgi:2-oxoglutarate dehydrogenase E2 component (dihydrolipoamide succinyltransferase)
LGTNKQIPASAGIYEFKMPKLGESITEAAIIKWFKNVGDPIEEDEILLEVATDKVDSEVPSLVTGVVSELLYKQNDVIKIGETIAIIKTDGKVSVKNTSKKESNSGTERSRSANKKTKSIKQHISSNTSFKVENSNLFFSPLIVSIAKEHHISFEELARIPVSGNENRLRKSDLMNYIEEGRPYKFAQPVTEKSGFQVPDLKFDKGTVKIVVMYRISQMIEDRIVFSKHSSPHVTAYV